MAAPDRTGELYLWPYEEARKVAERVSGYEPGRPAVFQSGFGPSGLPHLGTMSEVLRPSYVREAFHRLGAGRSTRLVVFIDDMDGLRKVPENIPNRDKAGFDLGKPVSRIPDPFGECHPSFSEHMVGLLGRFLAPVEVDYELLKSSEMYASGRFDGALKLNDFDPVAAAGGTNRGTMRSFVVTSDGNVDIDFGRVLENPLIQGIEILGEDGGDKPFVELFSQLITLLSEGSDLQKLRREWFPVG